MEENSNNPFKGHQYISLETYRKSGASVRTPVWFAQEGSTLYVWTSGESGKAKRIRNHPQVKVAPSDQGGKPLGPFVDAEAQVNPVDSPVYQHGNQLMDRKYGLLKKAFSLMGARGKDSRVILKIDLK